MNHRIALSMITVAILALVGCAGPNQLTDTPNPEGNIAGFWKGLWHGIIAPLTFILSLFSERVSVYEVHNSGGWYDFGFLIGVGSLFGGGTGGTVNVKKSKSRDRAPSEESA